MSEDLIALVGKVAELPPEKRKEVLIFGQGMVAGLELAEARSAAAAQEETKGGDDHDAD